MRMTRSDVARRVAEAGIAALVIGLVASSAATAKVAKESTERAVATLQSAVASGDFATRALAIEGLGAVPSKQKKAVLPKVKEALKDPQWQVQRAAIAAILRLKDKSWEAAILAAMSNEALDAATEVLPLLAPLGEKNTLKVLKKALDDPAFKKPERYIDALADTSGSQVVKAWEMGLKLKKGVAARAAFEAKLPELPLPDAVPLYKKLIKKMSPQVQARILDRILEHEEVMDIGFMTPLLKAEDPEVVFRIAAALAIRGDASGKPVLVEALQSDDRTRKLTALRALNGIASEDLFNHLKPIAYADDSDVELLRAAYEVYATAQYVKLGPHLESRLDSTEIERRAAAVRVLGRVKGRAALQALHPLLQDGSDLIRREAAGAIADIAQLESVEPIGVALYNEREQSVRVALITALGRIRVPEAVPPLQAYIYDGDDVVREAAVRALVAIRHESAVELLKLKLGDRSETIRRAVVEGLIDLGPKRYMTEFRQSLPWIGVASFERLVRTHRGEMLDHIEAALASDREDLRAAALDHLARVGAEQRAGVYRKLALTGDRPATRVAGVEGIVATDGGNAVETLSTLARDRDMLVQVAAVLALGQVGAVEQEALLFELTDSTTERVRVAAGWSLLRL